MKNNSRGFTLIEVLIALCIIAIALAAAINATTQSTRATEHVKNTMAAHWVGLNALSEIQVGMLTFPRDGNSLNGKSDMLTKSWSWLAQKEAVPQLPGVSRVVVTVDFKNKVASTVVGYIPASQIG